MPDYIFKPSGNAAGVFANALEFEGFDPGESVPVADGTYDIYEKVVSALAVERTAAGLTSAVDEGELTFIASDYGPNDPVTVTVTGGDYAGSYTTTYDGTPLTWGLIETTTVCLVKIAETSGNTNLGDTLAFTPSLWLTPNDPADPTFEQRLNGVPDGETALTRLVVGPDQGQDITSAETYDGITVVSDAVTITQPTTADDAQAIARHVASDVTFDGSNNVTGWPNSALNGSSGYDMIPVPDGSAPIWDAANGKVTFNGTNQGLVATSGFNPSPFGTQIDAGETWVWMIVCDTSTNSNQWITGDSGDSLDRTNSKTGFGTRDSGGNIELLFWSGQGGAAIGDYSNPTPMNNVVASGKHLLELRCDSTNYEFYIDGRLEAGGTVSGALNNNGNTHGKSLGCRHRFGTSGNFTDCAVYEEFITLNVAEADTFRAEIAARNGITLL